MNLETIIKAYENSAQWGKFSPNTVNLYTSYLTRLCALGGYLPIESTQILSHYRQNPMQLPVAVALYVADWQRIIDSFNGNQAKAMARRVLLNLFAWAKSYGFPVVNALTNLEAPRVNKIKDTSPFTHTEIASLGSLLHREDFLGAYKPYIRSAIVAFHSGMRPSEVEGLTWGDITEDHILIKSSKWKEKGKVSRYCKLTPEIKEVLPERRSPTELVFLSVEGRKLNKDMRSRAIHAACKNLLIEERDFYSTRRGTATEMHRAGYDLLDISRQLGHESLETTKIYIQLSMIESANRFKGVTNDKV